LRHAVMTRRRASSHARHMMMMTRLSGLSEDDVRSDLRENAIGDERGF
jgi:hypothetical protein